MANRYNDHSEISFCSHFQSFSMVHCRYSLGASSESKETVRSVVTVAPQLRSSYLSFLEYVTVCRRFPEVENLVDSFDIRLTIATIIVLLRPSLVAITT